MNADQATPAEDPRLRLTLDLMPLLLAGADARSTLLREQLRRAEVLIQAGTN